MELYLEVDRRGEIAGFYETPRQRRLVGVVVAIAAGHFAQLEMFFHRLESGKVGCFLVGKH